jgi:hypothetical protein
MKVQRASQSIRFLVLASMLLPVEIFAQEKPSPDKPPENQTAAESPAERRNVVEFGVRNSWGEVFGRPDLQLGPGGPAPTGNPSLSPGCLGCGTPFEPLLSTSKYQEYRDLRNGFFIRKIDVLFDSVGSSKNYVSLQSQKTIYRDQSYLATFGQYGKFKIQFRYDEIPHVYTNTILLPLWDIEGYLLQLGLLRRLRPHLSGVFVCRILAGTQLQKDDLAKPYPCRSWPNYRDLRRLRHR